MGRKHMCVRCKLCGSRVRLSKDQQKTIDEGRYSITVHCTNRKCDNRFGGGFSKPKDCEMPHD